MAEGRVIVGIGEILWDCFAGRRELGGAPANFAYHASVLGNNGIPVSRVGSDGPGKDILERLRGLGIKTRYLQIDPVHSTGTVEVSLDAYGIPDYKIIEDAAWDYTAWNDNLKSLASYADAVCFGSLGQRSEEARGTILKFLESVRRDAVLVFDINLRQLFYSGDIVKKSLELADVLKLNREEIDTMVNLLKLKVQTEPEKKCMELLKRYNLDLICLTLGEKGSILVSPDEVVHHDGFTVKVKDTVGAGDAFTAALTHHLLKGTPLEKINDYCNRYASWVASQRGGTPPVDRDVLEAVL
ncbi:MAG: carbohydrate kinase [Spirochaetes bacterium]|nr:carbohydrate kinase [Spirochaetota bacterium]